MSYVALVTANYEAMAEFYSVTLGYPIVKSWDRPRARGCWVDLVGMRLELMDGVREGVSADMTAGVGSAQIVVEVADVDAVHRELGGRITAAELGSPRTMSWGARMFSVRDPDGRAVWLLQWTSE